MYPRSDFPQKLKKTIASQPLGHSKGPTTCVVRLGDENPWQHTDDNAATTSNRQHEIGVGPQVPWLQAAIDPCHLLATYEAYVTCKFMFTHIQKQ